MDNQGKQGKKKLKITKEMLEEELVVFYQPIYSIEHGNFRSAEVLVRLYHNGRWIMPDEFIPVCEKEDIIHLVDEIAMRKACAAAGQLILQEHGFNLLEINVSVRSIEKKDMYKRYMKIIEKNGIPPSRINLEITESASIQDMDTILKNMENLRQAGVSFSLDDFGNGERSIKHIKEMPVNIVKFDSTIVRACNVSNRMYKIILIVIKMIHELGMKIVAEGIEDEQMFHKMDQANVDFIQGYYLSKPLSETEFLAFLQNVYN